MSFSALSNNSMLAVSADFLSPEASRPILESIAGVPSLLVQLEKVHIQLSGYQNIDAMPPRLVELIEGMTGLDFTHDRLRRGVQY